MLVSLPSSYVLCSEPLLCGAVLYSQCSESLLCRALSFTLDVGSRCCKTLSSVQVYLNQLEFGTFEELDDLRSDWDAVKVQSLIVTERVLGVSHKVRPGRPSKSAVFT